MIEMEEKRITIAHELDESEYKKLEIVCVRQKQRMLVASFLQIVTTQTKRGSYKVNPAVMERDGKTKAPC